MKKIILILVLSFVSTLIYSQKQLFGINGGALFSSTSIYCLNKKSFKIGWTSNINYERFLTENTSLEIGLQYEKKGVIHYFLSFYGSEEEIVEEYKYLSFPIGIKYSTGNKLKTFGKIGIIPSYFLTGEIIYPESAYICSCKSKKSSKNQINRFDLGAFIGLGISYQVSEKIELDINGLINYSFISMTSRKNYNCFYNINVGLKYYLDTE